MDEILTENRPTPARGEKGSVLVIVLSIVMLVTALMFVFIGRTGAEFRSQRFARDAKQAHWEAVAQLNLAMILINQSEYDAGDHNIVLAANADTGNPIPDTSVYVAGVAGAAGWYQLDAEVVVGSATRKMRLMVCEYDTFARFRLFGGIHNQVIAESGCGDIHVNNALFFSGPDLVFGGNVTSNSGFYYDNGASSSNVTVLGWKDGDADEITLPDISYLSGFAQNPYYSSGKDDKMYIELKADSVKIEVEDGPHGEFPLPANGIIYCEGNIMGVKGVLNGRLTIVSANNIYITDSIQYVDDKGETVYLNGEDSENSYGPNPDYTGISRLALIANDDVLISSQVDDSVEINALMYAQQGHVGIEGYVLSGDGGIIEFDWGFQKESVRYYGAIVSNEMSIDRIVFIKWLLSGFDSSDFVFDNIAAQNPPPYFPVFLRPRYTGWESIE